MENEQLVMLMAATIFAGIISTDDSDLTPTQETHVIEKSVKYARSIFSEVAEH